MPTITTYTYSVSSDMPNGVVSTGNLNNEIHLSSIVTALERIDTVGDNLYIVFKDALSSADKTTLDGDTTGPAGGLLASHDHVEVDDDTTNVVIKEETVATGGHFKLEMLKVIAPANQTTTTDFSFDYPINVMSATFITEETHRGDVLCWSISPNTTVGAITASYTAESTWISQNYVVDDLVWYHPTGNWFGSVYKCTQNTVSNEDPTNKSYWSKQTTTIAASSTVVDNLKVGFAVRITDGTNTEDIGYATEIDKTNSTITVNGAPSNNYSALTPSYIQMSVMFLDHAEVGAPMTIPVGSDKIGASYVPAGTVIRSVYENKSPSTQKTMITYIEILY
jgi:hypothetical protein